MPLGGRGLSSECHLLTSSCLLSLEAVCRLSSWTAASPPQIPYCVVSC